MERNIHIFAQNTSTYATFKQKKSRAEMPYFFLTIFIIINTSAVGIVIIKLKIINIEINDVPALIYSPFILS